MATGRAHPLHRVEPVEEGTTHGATEGQGLRLCGTCRRRDEVPEQAGLHAHQLRGNEEPGGGHPRTGDAAETTGLPEQPQHLRSHQGAAALR